MKFWPFKKTPDSVLGVDIGTSTVRVVELSKHGQQEKLDNYAQVAPSLRKPHYLGVAQRGELIFSDRRIAEMIGKTLEVAKIETRKAFFSIPDFSTFFTTFSLPPMKQEELSDAVRFEARQRVPLPITEVTLDWVLIKGTPSPREKERLEILLVVVPNRIIDRYTHIAELCNLKLKGVEAEVFSIQRAVARREEGVVGMIDIGAQSTTVSVVEDGVLKTSYSFDIAGHDLTQRVGKGLGVSFEKAEILKENRGLSSKQVKEALTPALITMVDEINEVADKFYGNRGKEVERYILAGATAAMPGLEKFFNQRLEREVKVSFPFQGMVYPSVLEKELVKIGPGFTISTGMALKGLRRLR